MPTRPPTQGRGSRHSPFLLPVKAKGRAGLAKPWGRPAGLASPGPGSPLLLQLFAQDVPPPGRHTGQARFLLLLLQQTAALPALPGAHPRCWHRGAAVWPRRVAPHPTGGRAEPRSRHGTGGGLPAHGSTALPLAARLLLARGGGRSARRGQPFAAHHSFIALTRGGPRRPSTANATPEGSAAPVPRTPHNTQPQQAAHRNLGPGAARTDTEPSAEPSRAAPLPAPLRQLSTPGCRV